MPLKVLHTADLHLGTHFPSLGNYGPEREKDFLTTFSSIIKLSLDQKVDLVLIAGDLFDSPHPSLNLFGTVKAELEKLIDANIKKGAVVTLNHPDWEKREHYGIDELASYENYTGIEIYNSVIERLDGSPLSTAKWDRLLSMGRKVLGFASQDFHIESDLSESSIIVNVKRKTAKDIIASINTGNFYCCLGVTLTEIKRIKDTIKIKTKNAGLIRFIGFGGTTLKKVYGRSASITFDKKDPRYQYIRVECLGTAGRISWTQPFFR